MDDLSRFCCLNSRCPDFGRRDAGNLTVTGRLGKHRQYRLLYCRSCRARFSERKGTPLYRAHLPEGKVTSILEHITEGCGVLKTARLVKVHPDTVSRYSRAAGEHARAAHDELVARSPETRELQMDEKWSFVAKEEKNCDEDDPEDQFRGDCWDHVAFDPLCGRPHNGSDVAKPVMWRSGLFSRLSGGESWLERHIRRRSPASLRLCPSRRHLSWIPRAGVSDPHSSP
jgi:transposase-like protein